MFEHLKIGKAHGPSKVYEEIILTSENVGIRVLMEHCQRILDEKGMPADWATSVVIPIFRGKEDIMNCGMYRGAKLLEYGMKMFEVENL